MSLSIAERKLTIALLEIAVDQFSNHGCNDFSLTKDSPNGAALSKKEAKEIINSLNKDHSVGGEYFQGDWVHDTICMNFIIKKLKKEMPNE